MTKRTPEQLIQFRESELRKSQVRLARSRDTLIGDAETLVKTLLAWPLVVEDREARVHAAVEVLQAEIQARVAKALAQ